MTPRLPDWIKEGRLEHESVPIVGYKSAHAVLLERGLEDTRLYGTESMCGDWNGRVLVLLQDFAPTCYLRGSTHERPYCHDETRPTNQRLESYLKQFRSNATNETCGVLYGSAYGNLCRDDGKWRGKQPDRRAAREYGAQVTAWAIEKMPNLKAIACLGDEAWIVTCRAICPVGEKQMRSLRESVGSMRTNQYDIAVVPGFHPMASKTKAMQERFWNLVARESQSG